MAVREIVLYAENPAPLREKCKPVGSFNQRTQKLIKDLKDTLNASPDGIGLAAPQINNHKRVIVVCLGAGNADQQEPGPPIAFVNPEIIEAKDEKRDFDGCLSFPGLYGETVRPHFLCISGLDEYGKLFERIFEGFDAVVVHHEIDHLDGVLFIDRIEKMEHLYRIREDENGIPVKVPLSVEFNHLV
ncbi:MAG: peptide deformylase [Chloroflexota bacterium]|nr:peptide deformylase [Chloroflexota bacterium]